MGMYDSIDRLVNLCDEVIESDPPGLRQKVVAKYMTAFGDIIERETGTRVMADVSPGMIDIASIETIRDLPGFADEALPKLYEDLSFGYVLSRSYSVSDIRCSVKGWEDEDHRTANLYLGAYDAALRSAWLDYRVDGKSAAQSTLRFMEVDDKRSAVQWWISDIPDESTASVYSIYGAEGVEFGLPYGAELQVVFHAELTDGTRLSAMLTREIMPSANNSADGESEGPAMPIVLTKD